MKHNSNLIQMEDKEDNDSEDEIAVIQKQHKIVKKKKSKTFFSKDSVPVTACHEIKEEDFEFVEFVLGDFPKSQSLSKFHKMTSLSLVNQNITHIESIIDTIPEKSNLVFLCLNENLITSLQGIEKLPNLKELYVSFNQIDKIEESIRGLNLLTKLWICENKISSIENIPLSITELWLANNSIESIPQDIRKYINLENLNLGGNLICDFQDIYNLQTIPKLKKLNLSDVNFGDNPICQYTQYRILLIHFLPLLINLDQIDILEEERKEVENLYIKKTLYFKNKVRNTHKTAKSIIQLLNRNKLFFNQWKMLQCSFFTQRSQMLQFAYYEKSVLCSQSDTSSNDISNEIISSIEKVKLCHNAINIIEDNYIMLKDYLKELNNMSIVMNFYEMESGGNFKIEPGHLNQKWTKSCLELIKSKMHFNFIEKNDIKSISFHKVFKVVNKKSKIIFDSLYDNLIDSNGKFGDEKKYFDFFFLIFDKNDLHSVLSFLFEDNHNNNNNNEGKNEDPPVNFYLTDSMSLIDEIKLKSNPNAHFITIICKCTLFDSMIEKRKAYPEGEFSDIQSIINALKSSTDSNREIIKITIGEESFYNYTLKGLIIPEYLIEYEYITELNPGKGFVSSFTSNLHLQEDYFNLFNQCSKEIFNDEMKYYDSNYVQKYSLLKMTEFDEFDNGVFYFAKNSIISFMTKCFKYSSYVDFQNEFFKIKEKINEISSLNFQTNLLERLTTVESCEDELLSKLTIINLFNCKLTTQSLNVLFAKFEGNVSGIKMNIVELSCPHNDIDTFNIVSLIKLFPNLVKIDYSTNSIESIVVDDKDKDNDNDAKTKGNLNNKIEIINLSYNKIIDLKCFIDILDRCEKLTHLFYYGNPLLKYFSQINQLKYDYDSAINVSNYKTELMKAAYKKYEEEQNTQIKPIEASKEMFELKTGRISFDILYDSYSFNDKYRIFSSSKYFKEQMNKESNKQSLILSKRKLKYIPLIENQDKTEILWINLNKITQISNLNSFSNLYELYIQNNKIKAIENLPLTLIKLDISNNLLENLSGISQTPNLIWLNVENNMIATIHDVLSLEKLKEFHSGQNFISNVKECYQLKQLPSLELVDISGNDVCRNVHEIRLGMIFYCSKLKNLNKINVDNAERAKANEYFEGRLTDGILETKLGQNYNLKELVELDLSSLKLKDTESIFSCESYPKLLKLNLSRNLFKSFTIFGYLPTLVELNLNYNIITEIKLKKKTATKVIGQKGLLGLPNLESLELSGNGLSNISGIQSLTNLKSLVLRENNLNKIEAITSMKYLTFLDLSFNKLRNLDKLSLGILPSIQIILLDNNYLKNINGFAKFDSVQTLSFENNKIQDTQSISKLVELPQLKDLSLNNNLIEKIPNYRSTLIKMFNNLYKLDGVEITSEERDMILIEMQMGEFMEEEYNMNYFYPQQMLMMKGNQNNMIYNNSHYNGMKQDKGAKVNFVNLDFFLQNRIISPNNLNVLPQIKPNGFPNREKPTTSDSKRAIKQGQKYVSNQVKVNSLINTTNNNSKRNNNKEYTQVNNFPSQLLFNNNANDYYGKQPPKK